MKNSSMASSLGDLGATDMNRRKFIAVGGVSAAAVVAGLCVPASGSAKGAVAASSLGVSHLGRVYRAGTQGRILVSDNNEKTWQVHANFGPGQIVRRVEDRNGSVVAEIGLGSRTFDLHLHKLGNSWVSKTL